MANRALREAIAALMDTQGETGVLRAVEDEMDLRLVRAMGNAQRLREVVQAAQKIRGQGTYEDDPDWDAWDAMAETALNRWLPDKEAKDG